MLPFRSYVGFIKLTFVYKSRAGAPEMFHLQGRGKAKRNLRNESKKALKRDNMFKTCKHNLSTLISLYIEEYFEDSDIFSISFQ